MKTVKEKSPQEFRAPRQQKQAEKDPQRFHRCRVRSISHRRSRKALTQSLSPLCTCVCNFRFGSNMATYVCTSAACQQEEPNVQAPTNVVGPEKVFLGPLLEDICSGLSFHRVKQPWKPCSACYPPHVSTGSVFIKTQKFRVSPNDTLASMLTTTATAAPACQWQAGQARSDSDGVGGDNSPSSQRDGHIKCQMRLNGCIYRISSFLQNSQVRQRIKGNRSTTSPSPSIAWTTARTRTFRLPNELRREL